MHKMHRLRKEKIGVSYGVALFMVLLEYWSGNKHIDDISVWNIALIISVFVSATLLVIGGIIRQLPFSIKMIKVGAFLYAVYTVVSFLLGVECGDFTWSNIGVFLALLALCAVQCSPAWLALAVTKECVETKACNNKRGCCGI